jgi:hypothetical protein
MTPESKKIIIALFGEKSLDGIYSPLFPGGDQSYPHGT